MTDTRETPQQIAEGIFTSVDWQMDNFLPKKGESSSDCQIRRYKETIAEAITEDRESSDAVIKQLREELSDLKSRMYREITLYGKITENILNTEPPVTQGG